MLAAVQDASNRACRIYWLRALRTHSRAYGHGKRDARASLATNLRRPGFTGRRRHFQIRNSDIQNSPEFRFRGAAPGRIRGRQFLARPLDSRHKAAQQRCVLVQETRREPGAGPERELRPAPGRPAGVAHLRARAGAQAGSAPVTAASECVALICGGVPRDSHRMCLTGTSVFFQTVRSGLLTRRCAEALISPAQLAPRRYARCRGRRRRGRARRLSGRR